MLVEKEMSTIKHAEKSESVEVPGLEGDMSEREEGEIVEELSDISSEEEYLLRQRLHVLETYNHVLERKHAKRRSLPPEAPLPAPPPTCSRVCTDYRLKKRHKTKPLEIVDLSEISDTELQDVLHSNREKRNKKKKVVQNCKFNHSKSFETDVFIRRKKHFKSEVKPRTKHKEKKRKKVITEVKSDSSETDYEYRNKRRRLQNAVSLPVVKNDSSSLKSRLFNMLSGKVKDTPMCPQEENEVIQNKTIFENEAKCDDDNKENKTSEEMTVIQKLESIDLTEDDTINNKGIKTADNNVINCTTDLSKNADASNSLDINSDDDLEVLRQQVLESKTKKLGSIASGSKSVNIVPKDDAIKNCSESKSTDEKETDPKIVSILHKENVINEPIEKISDINEVPEQVNTVLSEEEDSDTAELRMICLKSALLKKAMEIKQQRKLRKRLSTLSDLDETLIEAIESSQHLLDRNEITDHSGSTDNEYMDMEIELSGSSDTDHQSHQQNRIEYEKDNSTQDKNRVSVKKITNQNNEMINVENQSISRLNRQKVSVVMKNNTLEKDDLEEDEDLLRAKLLTSLSHSLPKLVKESKILYPQSKDSLSSCLPKETTATVPQPTSKNQEILKKFVINVGEDSDSSDHEATKNLTKMHQKLAESKPDNVEFQQKLDLLLKSARSQVEGHTLPEIESNTATEKFIPKEVNHLPKSNQLEYKQLVRRMAELEKLKQSRQASLQSLPMPASHRATNNLANEIEQSRAAIAVESRAVVVMRGSLEALQRRLKLALSEVKNTRTALTLAKRQLALAHRRLSVRTQSHKLLLARSTRVANIHSSLVPATTIRNTKLKGNSPEKSGVAQNNGPKSLTNFTSLKVSVPNDLKNKSMGKDMSNLSVRLNVTANNKTVTVSNDMTKVTKHPERDDQSKTSMFTNDVKKVDNSLNTNKTQRDVFFISSDSNKNSKVAEDITDKADRKQSVEHVIVEDPKISKRAFNGAKMDKTESQDNGIENCADDYCSPLQSLSGSARWADPLGVLCPFEVGGACRDPECTYLHPLPRPRTPPPPGPSSGPAPAPP